MQAAHFGLVRCMIPEDSGEYSGMANSAPLYHRNWKLIYVLKLERKLVQLLPGSYYFV